MNSDINWEENKKKLIYDLIFGEKTRYYIDISDYLEDIYEHESFINEIKNILKKSKVTIIENKIDLDSKSVYWQLKVKK